MRKKQNAQFPGMKRNLIIGIRKTHQYVENHKVSDYLVDHRGKTIFRMGLNPQEIIARIELGTSPLQKRIKAVNKMCEVGYPVGILIAPVILTPEWQKQVEALNGLCYVINMF